MTDSAELAQWAAIAAEGKKARDVRILDIRSISVVADYFVICSGTSGTHVRAIVDHVEEELDKKGHKVRHVEGYSGGRWVLLDFGDVVVHVMQEEEREFYNLERLWGDAVEVAVETPAVG
ncbi:ribosome silencing factor [Symbiobacterium thermophilum]|uniref:Ribosomal silencing factor RsfS n=1 Tax=Symbiobacterium thermophilum TaxID=2734 RepID=A0A953IA43_SYMTR|nr:ribosome silencing factor [Symbiobacterium thermophilum]MBY6277233.1 ribosome silencing factor [Symbiobacterium thermophilum]